jgi:hypothetical protein
LVNIKFEGNIQDKIDIRITDLNGKVLAEKTQMPESQNEVITFNLSDLPKGIYFVRVLVGDDIFVDKIMRY